MDELDLSFNTEPICPHCGSEFNISENEAWHLYNEDGDVKYIECPDCEKSFFVQPNISYTFSTDKKNIF